MDLSAKWDNGNPAETKITALLQRGYTFVEAILVLGILSLILAISSIGLTRAQGRTNLVTTIEVLRSDIRHQQYRAMSGEQDSGGEISSYGVRFDANSYTLFRGNAYDSNDSTNFTLALNDAIQFGDISGASIVFAAGSGEVENFSPEIATIDLIQSATGEQMRLTISPWGVVDQIAE